MRQKSFLIIIFFILSLSNYSHSSSGSGPLKFSYDEFTNFLDYMRGDGNSKGEVGRKRGTPWFFTINQEGKYSLFTFCPSKAGGNCVSNPGGLVRECTKRSKARGYGRCYIFAKQRKIVWDGKNIRLPRKFDQTLIERILKENKWFGSSDTQTSKPKKQTNQATSTKKTSEKNDTVEQLKKINEMFKSGVLSEEEFIKAKKKILN